MSPLKLHLAYDGTAFLGWQKSKMGRTVEGELQRVLELLLQEPITLQATSRTDAGVHARSQFVQCNPQKQVNLEKLFLSLNALLPKDVVVKEIEFASEKYHPTLDAQAKEYRYFVCNEKIQMPDRRLYAWHFQPSLNLEKMQKAALFFQGEHDFAAFCNVKQNEIYENTVRKIHQVNVEEVREGEFREIQFKIVGNKFLYKMVRNLVGTLVYVGCGKLQIQDVPKILIGKDRTLAGITAPSHGLWLWKILFESG